MCERVSAVLSDGPDPAADPVGYAEAQVLPLRQIHSTDRALQQAIERLASAYHEFYVDDGAGEHAKKAVAAAGKAVDVYCPGAVS